MADVLVELAATFVDFEGSKSTVTAHQLMADTSTMTDLEAAAGAFGTAVEGCSVASLWSTTYRVTQFNTFDLPSAVGAYPNIEDKLFIEGRSKDTGATVQLSVPSPKATDFGTGETETWNPADASVITLVAWYATNAVGNGGGGNVTIFRGQRTRKHGRPERAGWASAKG